MIVLLAGALSFAACGPAVQGDVRVQCPGGGTCPQDSACSRFGCVYVGPSWPVGAAHDAGASR
jgi:hypothetical protein